MIVASATAGRVFSGKSTPPNSAFSRNVCAEPVSERIWLEKSLLAMWMPVSPAPERVTLRVFAGWVPASMPAEKKTERETTMLPPTLVTLAAAASWEKKPLRPSQLSFGAARFSVYQASLKPARPSAAYWNVWKSPAMLSTSRARALDPASVKTRTPVSVTEPSRHSSIAP